MLRGYKGEMERQNGKATNGVSLNMIANESCTSMKKQELYRNDSSGLFGGGVKMLVFAIFSLTSKRFILPEGPENLQ